MKISASNPQECILLSILIFMSIFIAVAFNINYTKLNKNREIVQEYATEVSQIITETQIKLNFLEEYRKNDIERRIESLQPKIDPLLRKKIAEEIIKNSEVFKLSPSLVTHLICKETVPRFNPLSKSTKGAIGLMQIMFEVHAKEIPELAELGMKKLYHISNNIKFGCQILRGYINSTKTLDDALKKYVGGDPDNYINGIYRLMAEYEQGRWEKKSKEVVVK